MSKSTLDLLEERAQLLGVEIPEEIQTTIELGEEFKDYCGRLASEIEIYIRAIQHGSDVQEAIKNLKGVVRELEDMSHGIK